MTEEEIAEEIAVKIMGWELLTIGYFGAEDETPRQRELVEWMVEIDIWQVGDYWIDVSTNFAIKTGEWMPATDIAQAWQVLEKFPWPKYGVTVRSWSETEWQCRIDETDGLDIAVEAVTAPMAICLCALKTLEKE